MLRMDPGSVVQMTAFHHHQASKEEGEKNFRMITVNCTALETHLEMQMFKRSQWQKNVHDGSWLE